MKKATLNYWVDMATGVAFIACGVTGIVRLFPATAAVSDAGTATILGVSSVLWTSIHDWSGVAMATGVALHLALHAKWLVRTTRQLFGRRRPRSLDRQSDAPIAATEALATVPQQGLTSAKVATVEQAEPRMDRKAFLTSAAAVGGAALLLGLTLTSCDQTASSSSSTSDSASRVAIDAAACTGCGDCVQACSHGALAMNGSTAVVQSASSCTLCGHCVEVCRANAITLSN